MLKNFIAFVILFLVVLNCILFFTWASDYNNEDFSKEVQTENAWIKMKTIDSPVELTQEQVNNNKLEEMQYDFGTAELNNIMPITQGCNTTNLIIYDDLDIKAPINYSVMEDFFETYRDSGMINYSKLADTKAIQDLMIKGSVHYAFTPMPGEIGNSYFVGHSSDPLGGGGEFVDVFRNLEDSGKIGDVFVIYDNYGRKLSFRVYEAKRISSNSPDIAYFTEKDRRVVTLQTSVDDTSQRWIVRGELIWYDFENLLKESK